MPTAEAKRAAEAEARAVSGVKSVDNQLTIVPASEEKQVENNDAAIKDRVVKRLDDIPDIGDDVSVEVSNGTVRLTGTVDSQGERLQAITTARATTGVRSVIDSLQIDSSDQHATR